MLSALRQEIDRSLGSFLTRVRKEYRLHLVDPILYATIREFSLRKGKRIRPLLFLLSYLGYSPKGRRPTRSLYEASTCIEFLHNFMLIHDDIIDRSDLRRGRPTVHKILERTAASPDPARLGMDLAIIAGDIVYALAIDAFLSIDEDLQRKERALKYFIQTAAFTAMGEFIDTVKGGEPLEKTTEKDVFLNYSLKTARYTFDCPLVTGAILAGAREKEIRALARMGLLTGQAFQIQDDIIGIFATERSIGKSILSDLEEKKKTLLMTHAYRTLKGKKRDLFLKTFNKPQKSLRDLKVMRTILSESGSLDYALKALNTRVTQAKKILGSLTMQKTCREQIETAIFHLFQQAEDIGKQYP
ncbi:MAG: polyprenyl synthetase family protein [Elusimicrobia bacterium]|nr:polyprenyl synthetase family protein [Elusimicrobiota bacterium]